MKRYFKLFFLATFLFSCGSLNFDPWTMGGISLEKNDSESFLVKSLQTPPALLSRGEIAPVATNIKRLVARTEAPLEVRGLSLINKRARTRKLPFRPFYVGRERFSRKMILRRSFSSWKEFSNHFYGNYDHVSKLRLINGNNALRAGEWVILPERGFVGNIPKPRASYVLRSAGTNEMKFLFF